MALRWGRRGGNLGVPLFVQGVVVMPHSVPLPDVGFDLAGYVDVAIVQIGLVVLVVVGGFCAFLVLYRALLWAMRGMEVRMDRLPWNDRYDSAESGRRGEADAWDHFGR